MKTGYIAKQLAGTLVFFSLIFISAGNINFWPGWIYVTIGLIMFILSLTFLKPGEELMEERARPGKGSKSWDKYLLGISFLLTLSIYIVAGLDAGRYKWSPEFHMSAYVIGAFLTVSGQILFLVAQKQNRFFSSTVRIQTERNHTVIDSGLYKMVRHPAYLGSVIQTIGFPLIFGSLWSIIPAGLLSGVLVTRTILEDRTLMKELEGYAEYAGTTRYRLIPLIW